MIFIRALHNQKTFYIVFVFVLMFTNTVLLFTEGFGFFAKIAVFCIPLSIQMLLLALSKRPGKVFLFLLPKCIIDAFQLVLIKLFGGSIIAVDMFLNLATTSTTEAGELLSNLLPTIAFLLILYIPSILLAVRSIKQAENIDRRFRKKCFLLSGVIFLIGAASLTGAKFSKSGFTIKYDLYPCNVVYNLDFAIKKYYKILNCDRTTRDFTFEATKEDRKTAGKAGREIYVLILGETARASNWHIYGYPRNTTPHLDTLTNLIKYRDVLTQSNTTHKIVPMVFSPADADNFDLIYRCKSLVTAFKEVGFKTVFLSNQSYNKSFTENYYNAADIKYNIKKVTVNTYDHQLLPLFNKIIEQDTTSNMFIILHLYGSHFNYHQRYAKEFQQFVPDEAKMISQKYQNELINSFDNSILSTDDFITRVISKIHEQGCQSSVLYLSDHGEDMRDDKRGRFLHASPIPTYYQLHIPYLIWMSEKYKELNAEKFAQTSIHSNYPISNNTVFHTMLDLASIHTKYLDSTLSVSSPKLKRTPRKYLDDHDLGIRIDKIRFTKYDYEQFLQRGLELH
ncbi:MAG: lipid A phosphoethanolamine transferase [Bacteroidales bacterium]